MKNIFENLFLSKEVKQAMAQTRASIDNALEATQMIESIYVTKRLSEMFGADQEELATALKEDFYAEMLTGSMLRKQEKEEGKTLLETF